MSIPTNFAIRYVHQRLQFLRNWALHAPQDSFELTKNITAAMEETMNSMFTIFRTRGINLLGDDRAEMVEAMIYHLVKESLQYDDELVQAEGFGAWSMAGPEERKLCVAIATAQRDVLENNPDLTGEAKKHALDGAAKRVQERFAAKKESAGV